MNNLERAQAKINELQLKIKKLSNKNIDLTKLPPPNKQPPIDFNCCWNYWKERKKNNG